MFKSIRELFQTPSKLNAVANVLDATITLNASAHAKHEDRITKLEEDFAEAKGLNQSRFEKRPTKADLLTVEMQQQDQIDALKVQVAELTKLVNTILGDQPLQTTSGSIITVDPTLEAKVLAMREAVQNGLAGKVGDCESRIKTVESTVQPKKSRKKASKATVTDASGCEAIIEKVVD